MRIFLTEFYADGKTFCGDRINAISWKDAEVHADEMGLNITGEWIEDVDYETGKITPNFNYN